MKKTRFLILPFWQNFYLRIVFAYLIGANLVFAASSPITVTKTQVTFVITAVNSISSAALSPLTLGTGTFGTAVTYASATGVPTFAQGAMNFTGATTITGGDGTMIIRPSGNSRTVVLQSTTAGGTATTFLTGNADQSITTAGDVSLATSALASGNPLLSIYGFRTGVSAKYGKLQVDTGGQFNVTAEQQLILATAGANSILFKVNGTQYSSFDGNSGQQLSASGSAASPQYGFISDSNKRNGLYYSGTDIVGIGALGTAAMTWSGTTTTALGNLTVSGTGASTLGAAGSVFTFNGAVASTLPTNGTVVISGSGGLGVGGQIFAAGNINTKNATSEATIFASNTTGGLTNADFAFSTISTGEAQLHHYGNYAMTFWVNNSKKMTLSAAGGFSVGSTTDPGAGALLVTGAVTLGSKVTTYNNIATAGNGVSSIQGAGSATAQTGAASSIASYTVGASDADFIVSGQVTVTASATNSFSLECAYTDAATNTARVVTFNVQQLTGTLITAITNVTGTGPYEGVPLHLRAKASTSITIRTNAGGTYTSVTYDASGVIQKLQ